MGVGGGLHNPWLYPDPFDLYGLLPIGSSYPHDDRRSIHDKDSAETQGEYNDPYPFAGHLSMIDTAERGIKITVWAPYEPRVTFCGRRLFW